MLQRTVMPAILALAAGTAFATPCYAQGERYEVSGDRVAVYNLAGEVTLTAARGGAVTVEVARGGADAADLHVEQGRIDGHETLRIIYPADDIRYDGRGGGSTDLRVRDDGTFSDGGRGGRRVRVSDRRGDFEAHADLRIGIPAGQTLEIYLAVGSITATNVDGDLRLDTGSSPVSVDGVRGQLLVDVGSGNVEVRNAEAEVNVDTGSGNVEVNGARGDELLVDTGSGNVTVADVTVSELNVDTGSGDVEVDDLTAEDVSIDTGSGSVDIVFSGGSGDLLVDTGSGDVEITFVSDADDVSIDTGSGSVTLRVPEEFGAQVDFESSSGDFDLEFPLQVLGLERNHIRGELGDGRGRLSIETGSGDIRLLRAR
jgi:lia operon protein LiaG